MVISPIGWGSILMRREGGGGGRLYHNQVGHLMTNTGRKRMTLRLNKETKQVVPCILSISFVV